MKATTRRGAGAAGDLPAVKAKKKRKEGAGGFMWGCGGARSVSVAAGNLCSAASTPREKPSSATAMETKPASAMKKTTTVAPIARDAEGASSVDTLLRQLRELERGVRALGVRDRESGGHSGSAQACRCSGSAPPRPHRRSASDVWGGSASCSAAARRGRLEDESVAVVTETVDPLGEFRRSMAEMVVENGITGGPELRELLQRFLSLNSACHHHLILLAFADVWEELFAGSGDRDPQTSKHPYSTRSSKIAG